MNRKLVLVVLLPCVLLIAAVGAWFGWPAYKRSKEAKLASAAEAFMAKKQFQEASVAARKVLQSNPLNLRACLVMAELAEGAQVAQALEWRRRIAQINPGIEQKLRLASTAVKFEQAPYSTASQVLAEIGSTASNLPAFHATAAELAMKLNRAEDAAMHLELAARLDPGNEDYVFTLGVLRLQSTNSSVAEAGRKGVASLTSSKKLGLQAQRWLLADRLKQRDVPGALEASSQVLKHPWAQFEDRLEHLSLLDSKHDEPALVQFMKVVGDEASTNAVRAYGFSAWVLRHRSPEVALEWLEKLADSMKSEQAVQMAFVDAHIARKDWRSVEGLLAEQNWKQYEYLRLAYMSRAAAEAKETMAAEARWRSAVREAGDKLNCLVALLKFATEFKDQEAKDDLLWRIVQRFPRERWATRELNRIYSEKGNTRGLNKLFSFLAGSDPTNFVVLNNFAATSLLLGVNTGKAREIAKDVYHQHPGDPTILSTYAFSLYQEGKEPEALALMEKLALEDRSMPGVALYYGVMLAKAGKTNEAAKYLQIASKTPLLPEERELLSGFTSLVQ